MFFRHEAFAQFKHTKLAGNYN